MTSWTLLGLIGLLALPLPSEGRHCGMHEIFAHIKNSCKSKRSHHKELVKSSVPQKKNSEDNEEVLSILTNVVYFDPDEWDVTGMIPVRRRRIVSPWRSGLEEMEDPTFNSLGFRTANNILMNSFNNDPIVRRWIMEEIAPFIVGGNVRRDVEEQRVANFLQTCCLEGCNIKDINCMQ